MKFLSRSAFSSLSSSSTYSVFYPKINKAIITSLFFMASNTYAADLNTEKNTLDANKAASVKSPKPVEQSKNEQNSATIKTVVVTIKVDENESSIEKIATQSEKIVEKDKETIGSVNCEEKCDDASVNIRIGNNSRDGFFLGLSAISSTGDDFSLPDAYEDEAVFDLGVAYRMQLASLFIESPGLSSRRIHGMYSMPAWGLNFYDNDDWSFDLFYQYSTRSSKGLAGIQMRNEDERAGVRITGYLENSQLQFIFSPVSRNNEGSDGIEASLSYGYSGQLRNWTYYADVGVQYRSKEILPYHAYEYTVLPEDTNTSTSAGLSYSAKAGLEYPLSTDWVFSGFVAYHALSDRNIAYRQDDVENGYRAGLSLSFIF